MDLNSWQTRVRERLQASAATIRGLAPGTLYGFLAGSTLLPLVAAVNQGDLAALATLGTIAGGVGGNLIANQVQAWKDRSDAELAAELGERAAENAEWRQAIDAVMAAVETPRIVQAILSEADRDWFVRALRDELGRLGNLTQYEAHLSGSGAIVQGPGAVGAGAGGVAVGRDVYGDVNKGGTHAAGDAVSGDKVGGDKMTFQGPAVIGDNVNAVQAQTYVFAETGATVVVGEVPVAMDAVARESALGRYLQHVISRNRFLQLQGIRSGGRLVHIELDRIFVRLRTTEQRQVESEERWLHEEAAFAPGELARLNHQQPRYTTETVTISVEDALAGHDQLVVLGDPGSGKTTLLRYLALLYARDLAEQDSRLVQAKLVAGEPRRLPILLPLRQVATFVATAADDGTEGHVRLLEFLLRVLRNERIRLPEPFFDEWLASGNAVILLDGLDEVADPDLRRRVARLVEGFTQAYPQCRYVVTSRIVGYSGTARLGEGYTTTTVRDFTLADVERFLSNWHSLVAIGQMGPGESAEAYAAAQTQQLLAAIRANERIRALAINPLMLTVIAMVHRDRVKLPDRRAELYAEAVDVLLGKWDEARGLVDAPILPGNKPFDAGDKRLILQSVALHMHEQEVKEIDAGDLRLVLAALFAEIVGDARSVEQVVGRFLHMIEERTGLLVARGEGVYAFSHLTFQEYLAAVAIAAQDDYVAYTLAHTAEAWWREVVLLEAGHLSMQSKERTARLIRAIAELTREPQPYHNLVLASDCLRDVGSGRVQGTVEQEVQQRLRNALEAPPSPRSRWLGRLAGKSWVERRSEAMQAIVRAGGGYWTQPYGEPEWIHVPAGEFWMGSEKGDERERPLHKLFLDEFWIARIPITNAQYALFVQGSDQAAPDGWEEKMPPKGREGHPVVNVTWVDAMAYCAWLSRVTGRTVTLPTEAQWEKAARGDKDRREYPWGDEFDATKCNNIELGHKDTTPAGIFPEGASLYNCLDMAGNVWEWTRSLWGADAGKPEFGYPYDPADGRERLDAGHGALRVLRGGSFGNNDWDVRCAARFRNIPGVQNGYRGFRVVLSPFPLDDDASGR